MSTSLGFIRVLCGEQADAMQHGVKQGTCVCIRATGLA
jgi:hypothetical protein